MVNEGADAAFEKKIAELWQGKDDRIEKAKSALLDHYTKQQNSQAARLIGFVAAFFVLLQITQTGIGKELAKIFSNFPTITLFNDFPVSWDLLKFIFLFLATSIIL